jgi:hypothetical protein
MGYLSATAIRIWNPNRSGRPPVSISYAAFAFSTGNADTVVGAEERSMLDLIMLALGVGGFALLIGYVALCERL